jgi:hypothetical protein
MLLKDRRRARRAEVRGVIPSSESTIVSAVELVWKAMELLQSDEDRVLRAELSLQEVLLNGHLQPGE